MIEHENDQLVSVASETDINTSNNTSDESIVKRELQSLCSVPHKTQRRECIDISCVVLFCNII